MSRTLVLAECADFAGEALAARPLYLGLSNAVKAPTQKSCRMSSNERCRPSLDGKADIASIIHTDRWRGYDGLVEVGFDKHLRVNHGRNEFARGSVHVNGIESF